MTNRVRELIYPMLAKRSLHDDDLYLFLTLTVAIAFIAIVHTVLFLFFIFGGFPALALIDLASLMICASCQFLCFKKKYLATGLIASLKVTAYAAVITFLTGFDTIVFLYFFLVLIIQIVIPYSKNWLRMSIVGLLLIISLLVVFARSFYIPPIDIGDLTIGFSLINIVIAFLAVLIEVSVGNIIKKIIVNYNETKLDEFKRQGNTDPLTGLYNKRYADLFFSALFTDRSASCWYIAIFGIDDFHVINNEKGYSAGDAVLVELSQTIKNNLRRTDTIFRWGDDEFLVLLEGTDLQLAYSILEKVRNKISQTDFLVGNGETVGLTVTVGATILNISDINSSIESCEKKMNTGKSKGKNQLVM